MSDKDKKAEVVPIKKENIHTDPRYLLTTFDDMEKLNKMPSPLVYLHTAGLASHPVKRAGASFF